MGNIVRNVSGDEGMEETVDFYERYSSLYNNIKGVLNADNNVVKLLLFYFPDEPVDYLTRFWWMQGMLLLTIIKFVAIEQWV